jgi:hypothetical protein
MDQGVFASMKRGYQADLRALADEDISIIALWKRMMVMDATCVWHMLGMVLCGCSNTSSFVDKVPSGIRKM